MAAITTAVTMASERASVAVHITRGSVVNTNAEDTPNLRPNNMVPKTTIRPVATPTDRADSTRILTTSVPKTLPQRWPTK
jgi:hypothetical protein